jgi:hypothetical protein
MRGPGGRCTSACWPSLRQDGSSRSRPSPLQAGPASIVSGVKGKVGDGGADNAPRTGGRIDLLCRATIAAPELADDREQPPGEGANRDPDNDGLTVKDLPERSLDLASAVGVAIFRFRFGSQLNQGWQLHHPPGQGRRFGRRFLKQSP